MQKFKCARLRCDFPISNMSQLLSISLSGLVDSYCDSWGVINGLVTVTDLEDGLSVVIVENISSDIWFFGYTSSAIFCPNCANYVGWKFVNTDKSSLLPKIFYGLSAHTVTSMETYILPLASLNDEMPLEENSDREIIFESVSDGDILDT
ncbi:protein cereblon homolog [Rhopalosiphum maidis]|nr:protein cereblon homolog [Rhopalosiphum maidis]